MARTPVAATFTFSIATPGPRFRDYLAAAVLVALAASAAHLVNPYLSHGDLALVFLLSVLLAATRGGLGPSLFAATLGFLCFNFFFTTPYHTLRVGEPGDLGTLVLFLAVAAITGHLAGRMRREIDERREALARLARLNSFARRLGAAPDQESAARALVDELADATASNACLFLPGADGTLAAGPCTGDPLPPPAETSAPAGGNGPRQQGAVTVVPLAAERLRPAAIVLSPAVVDPHRLQIAQGLCDQASAVLERIALQSALQEARMVSETEQLRSALLSSVSHDLRTPLASIVGASTSLLEYGHSFRDADRLDLLRTVVTEARRLDRYIQNLLDMTRLGRGTLSLRRDWVDVADVVSSAVARVRDAAASVPIDIAVAPDLPLLWLHGALVEQALVNVLDNAVNFSPAGERVRVCARRRGAHVCIEVTDAGPGIAPGEREKIFDMFYTGAGREGRGTGLGLAICRGMIVAHGGHVAALPGPDGTGTRLRISLPVSPSEPPTSP